MLNSLDIQILTGEAMNKVEGELQEEVLPWNPPWSHE